MPRLITVAIHTYEKALPLKAILEKEGIEVVLQNVNLEQPEVSSGVRMRIKETDLPLALRIIENVDIFAPSDGQAKDEMPTHAIIVPTDFSNHAYTATLAAFRLAKRHKVEIRMLHAYIAPNITGNVQLTNNLTYEIAEPGTVDKIVKDVEAKFSELNEKIRQDIKLGTIPAVGYSHKIVEGVPEDAITDYAKSNPPYIVVMGTRSWAKKEKEMIGSVTAEVLDECRFSVLTIPETIHADTISQPRQILFFSNLDQSDILAIDTMYRIFPDAGAKVTIVHIPSRRRLSDRTTGRSAIALYEYCRKKFCDYKFETVPVDPKKAADEMQRLNNENNFDLVVVPNRKKNAFSRLFNPSLAHRLLFQADIPMLVIPV